MSKIADYLREHIVGEVLSDSALRQQLSTDNSIFSATPQVVVYPRTIDDVRKVARFSWQLAERQKQVAITARGFGYSQTGGAIGDGISLIFSAHMNKLLELDTKRNSVVTQPGLSYRTLLDTLKTHGRFIPSFPDFSEGSTIGGATSDNATGSRGIKYGSAKDHTTSLKVVLSNGELIETGRLTRRELNRKKGLSTFEGEIYRQLDGLISDNWDLIQTIPRNVLQNSAGYNLSDVKLRDGSFDLTPLMVGSQGTLGIVVEAEITIAPNNMERTLTVAGFENIDEAFSVIPAISKLQPSRLEFINKSTLEWIERTYPHHLKGLVESPLPEALLLVEFDDFGRSAQNKKSRKLSRVLGKVTQDFQTTNDYDERDEFWKIREATGLIAAYSESKSQALPILKGGSVPIDRVGEFYKKLLEILDRHDIETAVWGSISSGTLNTRPLIDISKVGQRQKLFKLLDEYMELVVNLGGTISGDSGDGRLYGPYIEKIYGEEITKLLRATKHVFDPHTILNPNIKLGAQRSDQLKALRTHYQSAGIAQFLPAD